jgi:hypothetical protein
MSRIEYGQRLSETFRKGRIVKYAGGPNDAANAKVGEVTHVNRNLVYVDFAGANIGEYGCYPPFLHTPTREERAVFIAKKALRIK